MELNDTLKNHLHQLWAEINLDAIGHNVRELRRMVHQKTRLMVMAKANGYGHGAIQVSRIALNNGATDIGVARVDEGINLRRAGIKAPILVLGPTFPNRVEHLIQYDLTPTVSSFENGSELAAVAKSLAKKLPFHIKIDSGMGRLGLPWNELNVENEKATLETILKLINKDSLEICGIYTHFASADSQDKTYAVLQFKHFMRLLEQLNRLQIDIPLRHAANSAAIIDMPDTHLDMVRAGIAVYGLYPSKEINRNRIKLKPAMSLKSTIVHTKHVPAGTSISYGCTHRTERPTVIATVPVGYADGFSRLLSNKGFMIVGERRAPIVGRVCMDLTMIDVGQRPEIKIGDEVVLIGHQGEETITADEIASTLHTINYEIVTALTDRVPRVYI